MKVIKENTKYIIVIMICIIGSAISGYATSSINSNEVKYDNSTSGLTSTNVQAAIEELNNNATDYATVISRLNNIVNVVYPVGSIYISTSGTNPANLFGGTWQAFGTGRTLVGINTGDGDFNSVEKTGGSKTKTLAVANIPSHTHSIPALSGTAASAGAHNHYNSTFFVGHGNAWVLNDSNSDGIAGTDNACPGCGYWTTKYNSTAGAHTHSVTTNASTTGATGSTSAFSTMDPYITVYMWKRTA